MSLLRKIILACVMLPLSACRYEAQAPAIQSVTGTSLISLETLKDITRTLSDDSFEGRTPGGPTEQKTVSYIAGKFEAAGLKPAGLNGSWYQPVKLVELTHAITAPLRFTGGKSPLSFAYKADMVIASYQVVPKTDIRESDVVFVGYGINAPERGWNDYAGVDVRGKTVIILVNDPDWQTQAREGLFDGRAMTYYGRWTYKYEEAARQGAAAAIIVHQTEPAAYPFDVVVSSWTGPQLHFDEPGNHMDQSQATGWVTLDAAQAIFASAGKDFATLADAARQKGFKAVPLGLKASVTFTTDIRRQESQNVVGILPGTTRPNEYVIYTAHWDHLGHCEPVAGDDICNGAVDNASGTAGLVTLAQAFRQEGAPERSVLFVAVTAEESGTLGSEYFAANPTVPLGQIAGGLNMDSLNVNGATRDIIVVGGGKSSLESYLTTAAAAQGRILVPEPTPEKGFYFRSDHFSLAKLGVPMLYTEAGEDLVNGGKARGKMLAEDYVQNRYHKPSDEYRDDWDWSGALQDLELNYRIGRALANSRDWPDWNPESEFRAIRDASRTGK